MKEVTVRQKYFGRLEELRVVGGMDLLLHLLLNLTTEFNSLLNMSTLCKNLISTSIF